MNQIITMVWLITQSLTFWDGGKVSVKVKAAQSVSDSLQPHGLSMEFSRPEYWSG